MGLGALIGTVVGGVGGFFVGGPAGAIGGAALGGSVGGSIDANNENRQANWEAGQISQSNSREQMAFQERMSSSAHQREREDLIKAGLNPILSTNAGASTPVGSSAQQQASQSQNVMEGAGTTAINAMNLKLGMVKQAAELELMYSQKKKIDVETQVAKKGIPEAELKNDVYDTVRPAIKWLKQKATTNAEKTYSTKQPPVHPRGRR